MNRAEILQGIADVAREQLGWSGELSEEMRLVERLGLDSLRLLTLVVEIEDRFRVCLDEEVDAQIETVADLIENALISRPELAAHQALVSARVTRLRQEHFRPLLPYIQLGVSAGTFGGGPSTVFAGQGGRSDIDALAVWELKNLGLGNLLLHRKRTSELASAELEAELIQDRITAEVITAAADESSTLPSVRMSPRKIWARAPSMA